MTIGERLREQRQRVGLSLGQVGEYEGLTPQYLSDLERGRNNPPAWSLLARLAARYRCTADYLLGLAEEPTGFAPMPAPPRYGPELIKVLEVLSDERRAELVAHAHVLLDAEQRATNSQKLSIMLDIIQAVAGEDAVEVAIEVMELGASDPVAAAARMEEFFATRASGRGGRGRAKDAPQENGQHT